MGKSDEKKNEMRAHKATGQSKHDATGESKLKKQSFFNTPGSSFFETTFEDNEGEYRHSQWQDLFRQFCEYKVQFGTSIHTAPSLPTISHSTPATT